MESVQPSAASSWGQLSSRSSLKLGFLAFYEDIDRLLDTCQTISKLAPGTTDGRTRSTCIAGWKSCVGQGVQICTSVCHPDSIERKSMLYTPHKGRTDAGDIAIFGQFWTMAKVMSLSSVERLIAMDFYGMLVFLCLYPARNIMRLTRMKTASPIRTLCWASSWRHAVSISFV